MERLYQKVINVLPDNKLSFLTFGGVLISYLANFYFSKYITGIEKPERREKGERNLEKYLKNKD